DRDAKSKHNRGMRRVVSPHSLSSLTKVGDVGWAKRRRRMPTVIKNRGGHGASRLSPPYGPLSWGMTRLGWFPGTLLSAICFVTPSVPAPEIPLTDRRSGTAFMSRETQAMQEDDRANPGMLAVLDGEALWNQAPAGAKACAGCHGDAAASMKGVAARYPAFDEARGRPIDLEQRINACRTEHQHAPPLAWESRELLALTAHV